MRPTMAGKRAETGYVLSKQQSARVSAHVRKVMEERGEKQLAVAERTGGVVTQGRLSNLFHGRVNWTERTLSAIAKAIAVEERELLRVAGAQGADETQAPEITETGKSRSDRNVRLRPEIEDYLRRRGDGLTAGERELLTSDFKIATGAVLSDDDIDRLLRWYRELNEKLARGPSSGGGGGKPSRH